MVPANIPAKALPWTQLFMEHIMSNSEKRKRSQQIHVRLTTDEYLQLTEKLNTHNQEIIDKAKKNGIDVTKLALLSMQNLMMDAALSRQISKPIILPATVDIAGLKDLSSSLSRDGGLLKAWLAGSGDHYSQTSNNKERSVKVVTNATSDQRPQIDKLIKRIESTVEQVRIVLGRLS